MLVFHCLPHEMECPSLSDEANKNKTFSVIAKTFGHGTPNGFGEILFKIMQILRRMYRLLTFCHPDISHFWMADISFNIACKELKIAQIVRKVNQLF